MFRKTGNAGAAFGAACALVVLMGLAAHAANTTTGKLVIVKAEYGDLDDDKTIDVTAKVAAMVKDNSLTVVADNAALGTPPGKGPRKLKVGYTIDGIYRSKTADQGGTLDISTRLIIRKAVYGNLPKGAMADVTDQVADLVRKNSLSITVGNELFGDPAEGVVKHFRVDYTLDGVDGSKTVGENDMLTITAPAEKKGK
ncbi:MAG TPA: hypothetical protein VFE47_18325 [Tepidisphaeraceae bacterium]|nr:hypothetical protein [Tepidisphaeraceae bacterium]